MRRLLTTLASAIVIAGLTLGFLYLSDLLRLDNWPQWTVSIGFFAIGGSVASDIWWREFKVLRASRRKRSRNLRTSGTKLTVLHAMVSRRVGAIRRSLRASNEVVGGFVLTALLLLLIGLLIYSSEDIERLFSDPELRQLIRFNR